METERKLIASKNSKWAHAYMIYYCDTCGNSIVMYLEQGIEQGGTEHKPAPYIIACPHCKRGGAKDVSGIKELPYEMAINDYDNYFANKKGIPHGVPVIRERVKHGRNGKQKGRFNRQK